ncbi:MAG: diacylglycerol kinase (ATP), partial [Myxococcota bacterium]
MNAEDVCFVVNPRSAGGRTAARLNELEREVARRFSNATVQLTRGPGDAEARARDAVRDGASVVVAVGGDGTASEVVNGLAGAPSATVFAVLPAGTGCDLVRTLEMPRDLGACLDVIASAPARPVDVVEVQATTPGGVVKRRCINVAGFGVNGEVVARANRSRKLLGGKLTFLLSTARAMAT